MNDYTQLFKDSNELRIGNFRCRYVRDAGVIYLSEECGHPLVFVLAGSLTAHSMMSRTLPAGNLMAINQKKIRECSCTAGTVILEYFSPPRFTYYLDSCSDAFHLPFSEPIPIMPALREWLDGELPRSWQAEPTHDELCVQRKAFARIMTNYPQHVMQELYVCFYACATSNCKDCDKEMLSYNL